MSHLEFSFGVFRPPFIAGNFIGELELGQVVATTALQRRSATGVRFDPCRTVVIPPPASRCVLQSSARLRVAKLMSGRTFKVLPCFTLTVPVLTPRGLVT